MYGNGFTFKGKHSSEFGIYLNEDNRSVLPAKRRRQLQIPRRHGRYDFGDECYENRQLAMTITVVEDSAEELRSKIRKLAAWLSGDGMLVFDDEPQMAYRVKIFGDVDLLQLCIAGQLQLVWEAEPFAYGRTITMPLVRGINKVSYGGTAETSTKIRLVNPSSTVPIRNITILVMTRRG